MAAAACCSINSTNGATYHLAASMRRSQFEFEPNALASVQVLWIAQNDHHTSSTLTATMMMMYIPRNATFQYPNRAGDWVQQSCYSSYSSWKCSLQCWLGMAHDVDNCSMSYALDKVQQGHCPFGLSSPATLHITAAVITAQEGVGFLYNSSAVL